MNIFRDTDWSFVTSGGAEVDIGISKFLFAAGEAGAFYVRKDSDSQIWRLPFISLGAGVGIGVSVGGPVTVQVSLPCQPGGGFRIYRSPLRRSGFGLESFRGSFVMVAGAAAAAYGGSVSFLFFGAPSSVVNVLRAMGPLGPAAGIDAAILACQGGGGLWGTAEVSGASIGATVYTGEILTVQPAAPHETGD